MGVPKFYRWISERYPCLSEVVSEFQIPEFDNLYLDMNGIVHVCAHPEDDNPHFRITEEKIFSDIFHYIEFLFRMIKPRRTFFMAIDGVAPRAKMNQQRGRRFRSAKEAEMLENQALARGEVLPTEKRFDSNCITPGTEFMVRLQENLKYFVVSKISTDPLWQGVKVYLSGHETPGEGEHKIMDFIRHQKAEPDYDPNSRHCLHGLDADLMMLGLCSHEPHFSLLREEVRFTGKKDKNKRPVTPEETTFHLLHLCLMREYLEYEFQALKTGLPFAYDLERIIDDWVLLGFLVGNDFIPHLPQLHIHHDALPLLWRTYIKVLPTLDGYLHDGGHLNLRRFEAYLNELAKYDFEKFAETNADLRWFEGKKNTDFGAKKQRGSSNRTDIRKRKNEEQAQNYLKEKMNHDHEKNCFDSIYNGVVDDDDTLQDEFKAFKADYYRTKIGFEHINLAVMYDQAYGYVRAIQWILLYYYEGVPSWSWFYPHHYAPYVSDVCNFANERIEFDICTPFLPFQQLMAVLPAASKELLPLPYQNLMTQEQSPVKDFYPEEFKTDLNGKLMEWEAVVLIPFIVEERLLSAMGPLVSQMTDEEKARNIHSPHMLYEYSAHSIGRYKSALPGKFPDIEPNHARQSEIHKFAFRIPSAKMIKGLSDGVRLDIYFPGFPTVKHIQCTAELVKLGVTVFQMASRNENMILKLPSMDPQEMVLDEVGPNLLGKIVYVGWPQLHEAKVITVSDNANRYQLVEPSPPKSRSKKLDVASSIVKQALTENESRVWARQAESISQKYQDRKGVKILETSILIQALPLNGRKYVCTAQGQVTLEKQWCARPVEYAYQAIVKDIAAHDTAFIMYKTVEELYYTGAPVFLIGWPHYGCQGEVMDVESVASGRVRVSLTTLQEPRVDIVMMQQEKLCTQYMPGHILAQRLGISTNLLARMTGTMFVLKGSSDSAKEDKKLNIGLNLKFTKRKQEVPGYTKFVDGWLYTDKTLETVDEYLGRFPDMWQYISSRMSEQSDMFYESDLFPNDEDGTEFAGLEKYLKDLPCRSIPPATTGAESLDEGIIKNLEKEVNKIMEVNRKKKRTVKMVAKLHLLYRPLLEHASIIADPSVTFELFDRVVNIRPGHPVPFGLRGTVIGMTGSDLDLMFDVLFDEEFFGAVSIRGSKLLAYRCPSPSLINLTHGERADATKHQPREGMKSLLKGLQAAREGENKDMSYSTAAGMKSENRNDNYRHETGRYVPPSKRYNQSNYNDDKTFNNYSQLNGNYESRREARHNQYDRQNDSYGLSRDGSNHQNDSYGSSNVHNWRNDSHGSSRDGPNRQTDNYGSSADVNWRSNSYESSRNWPNRQNDSYGSNREGPDRQQNYHRYNADAGPDQRHHSYSSLSSRGDQQYNEYQGGQYIRHGKNYESHGYGSHDQPTSEKYEGGDKMPARHEFIVPRMPQEQSERQHPSPSVPAKFQADQQHPSHSVPGKSQLFMDTWKQLQSANEIAGDSNTGVSLQANNQVFGQTQIVTAQKPSGVINKQSPQIQNQPNFSESAENKSQSLSVKDASQEESSMMAMGSLVNKLRKDEWNRKEAEKEFSLTGDIEANSLGSHSPRRVSPRQLKSQRLSPGVKKHDSDTETLVTSSSKVDVEVLGTSPRTKIDLQTLFSKHSPTPGKEEQNEFAAMLSSLQVSSNDQSNPPSNQMPDIAKEEESGEHHVDTPDPDRHLKALLHIEKSSSPSNQEAGLKDKSSATEQSLSASSGQSYGRQVSIQDLFEGAKLLTSQESHGEGNKKLQSQNQASDQSAIENRDPVSSLITLCQNVGLGDVRYNFVQSSKDLVMALVTLTNGRKFQGSKCRTRPEAMESAASMALLQLSQDQLMSVSSPGTQNLLFSSESAFSPVKPIAGPELLPMQQQQQQQQQQQLPMTAIPLLGMPLMQSSPQHPMQQRNYPPPHLHQSQVPLNQQAGQNQSGHPIQMNRFAPPQQYTIDASCYQLPPPLMDSRFMPGHPGHGTFPQQVILFPQQPGAYPHKNQQSVITTGHQQYQQQQQQQQQHQLPAGPYSHGGGHNQAQYTNVGFPPGFGPYAGNVRVQQQPHMLYGLPNPLQTYNYTQVIPGSQQQQFQQLPGAYPRLAPGFHDHHNPVNAGSFIDSGQSQMAPRKENPFIPQQVTRQKSALEKQAQGVIFTSSPSKGTSSTAANAVTAQSNDSHIRGVNNDLGINPDSHNQVKSHSISPKQSSPEDSQSQRARKGKSPHLGRPKSSAERESKKSRSRLAANFGFGGDER